MLRRELILCVHVVITWWTDPMVHMLIAYDLQLVKRILCACNHQSSHNELILSTRDCPGNRKVADPVWLFTELILYTRNHDDLHEPAVIILVNWSCMYIWSVGELVMFSCYLGTWYSLYIMTHWTDPLCLCSLVSWAMIMCTCDDLSWSYVGIFLTWTDPCVHAIVSEVNLQAHDLCLVCVCMCILSDTPSISIALLNLCFQKWTWILTVVWRRIFLLPCSSTVLCWVCMVQWIPHRPRARVWWHGPQSCQC